MVHTFLNIGQQPLTFLFCVLISIIPVLLWFFIFFSRHKHRWSQVCITFLAGMFSAAILLVYQGLWGIEFDFLFFSIEPENFESKINTSFQLVFFAGIFNIILMAFLEEYSKHWVVKKTDKNIFESIDDVIEFSIIAALGFAFLENIGYFLMHFGDSGFLSLYAGRSSMSILLHLVCSGIYGYFYGLAHFAQPLLSDWEKEGKVPRFPAIVHRITHMRKTRIFKDEVTTFGLVLAVTIHSIFNIFMQMGRVGYFLGLFIVLGGLFYLSYLLQKKEDQKQRGHIEIREEFVFGDKKTEQIIQ